MVQVEIYKCVWNEKKFLEVRRYSDGHQTIVQFQNTPSGRSYNGFKKPYRLRAHKKSLEYMLETDYQRV